jgi:hypothetical protein
MSAVRETLKRDAPLIIRANAKDCSPAALF